MRLNRFTWEGDPVSCAAMDLVSVPSIPAASFPLPPRLEGLIMCMLAKDPDRRPAIDEVDRELAAIAGMVSS